MGTPALLDRYELLAAWHRLIPEAELAGQHRYELDELGEAILNPSPSARRQIVLTDVYCHVTEQMGHLAAMSVPVITPALGIRVPDVVWMPCHRWESFDHDDPVPFVPDLCVEVLLDSDRAHDIDRRVTSYLEGGATEVIVVCHSGRVEFWGAAGRRQTSVFGIALSLDGRYFEQEGGVS
ncbi:Uma2 family endonuclease [Paraburkholderia madseniana]|jgi:Uma2 family endonuclease|uniref:Uma2 family endonuclease n=1 Tax=Paraburkholderia madseniana TaxID=2599607 RepID=A0A6N6W0E8_9BURK|nr:Uma2 family endonuclease [Paraburkholderia madseniana]KAE8753761.1 Uma2 family endonuclease [Paraburkholderia madseniana]